MGHVLAVQPDMSLIKAGEVLAVAGSVSGRASKQISVSADELLRNISAVLEDLVLSVIGKRTAMEFEAARSDAFPKYMNAVLALSSLVQILVPRQAIDRLNRDSFCELEADLRNRGLVAFGASVRDQAMFTVWSLRKISDFMSQIDNIHPKVDNQEVVGMVNDCIFYAIRTRFHVHCLVSSMALDKPIHPDAMEMIIDGLRSVVNAYALARRLLDRLVPLPEMATEACEWDDEDQSLLLESSYGEILEPA